MKFQYFCQNAVTEDPNLKIVIITNHPHCFTMGSGLQKKSGKVIEGLDEGPLDDLPYTLIKIDRGGGLTFHYPGQLVVYPIMKIGQNGLTLSKLANRLFNTMIKICEKNFALKVEKNDGELIGLWHDFKKIGSFGIGLKKFVTHHGLALNLNDDEQIIEALKEFKPCGIGGEKYSTVQSEAGLENPINEKSLADQFIENFSSYFA